MHANEYKLSLTCVRTLLSHQFPEWKSLTLKEIKHSGTDNAIFRLGEDKLLRFPRIASSAEQLEKEVMCLPHLSGKLPLDIPYPIAKGNPALDYPFTWAVYSWLEGETAWNANFHNKEAAKTLGEFIQRLSEVDSYNIPKARRGEALVTQDTAVRKAVIQLSDTYDPAFLTDFWEECVAAPLWDKEPVFFHGDLLPSNVLINNGKVSAVIDFGLAGVGDPACDMLPAWSLFTQESRSLFKEASQVDEATWVRGKGWALSIALIIIPYYQNTNPELVAIAQRIIQEISNER